MLRPSCELDGSEGLYDFGCARCLARLYLAALPREQPVMKARWHANMSEEDLQAIREQVEQLQGARKASA